MKKVKLQSSLKWKAGQKNNIVFAGEVQFDDNAIIEVDENQVEDILESMPEFSVVSEKSKKVEEDIKPQTQEEDLGKSDDSDQIQKQVEETDIEGSVSVDKTEENQSQKIPSKEELKVVLKEKTVKELRVMVDQLDSEKNKELSNKEQIIDFLVESLA